MCNSGQQHNTSVDVHGGCSGIGHACTYSLTTALASDTVQLDALSESPLKSSSKAITHFPAGVLTGEHDAAPLPDSRRAQMHARIVNV